MICCIISSDVASVNTPKNQIWIPNGASALAFFFKLFACRLPRVTQAVCFVRLLITSSNGLPTGRDRIAFTRSLDKILTFACCGMKNKIMRMQKADVNGSKRNTKRLRYEQVRLRYMNATEVTPVISTKPTVKTEPLKSLNRIQKSCR